ncbi:S8 family serine peptidase [Oceanirhabdus sp. W0125-5]|uniref:S8 family serine peptidase n=1 Tax=Oceanirhabdus sp. W0125-5 TaxID=2999116 RepID=UPI0022F2BCF3|nr:S8 family serine peptidase [Oceanirhabdus sp. W0125-5]WBW98142.1 S8 family serine peptidase [Oceanirhabdus sp. W0125-5]
MNKFYKRLISAFLMVVFLSSTIVSPIAAQGITIAKSEKKQDVKNSNNSIESKEKKDKNDKWNKQNQKDKSIIKNNNGKENHNNNNNNNNNSNKEKDKKESKQKNKNKNNIEETDRFIVKYKKDKNGYNKKFAEDNINQSKKIKEALKGKIKKSKKSKKKDYELILTNSKISYEELEKLASSDEEIEYIVPDYKIKLMSNDTYYDAQWGLQYIFKNNNSFDILNTTTGSAISINDSTTSSAIKIDGSKINSEIKYNTSTTSSAINLDDIQGDGVVVGVIDTGIDIAHEDLAKNIWINTNEIQNGIDDDNNGYIDDIFGWDFINNSNSVFNAYEYQSENHGTHIAGIISATKDNGIGVSGTAPKAKIIPLKVFENGEAYTSDIIEAIEYATNKNVKIMNCSWGSEHYNPILRDVIEESGMLFIFPAGNQGENIDSKPFYPASYDSENIITVGSINQNEELAYNSNYGQVSVDVYAPGENIISTLPNDEYGYLSGTSMATAFVTGQAALILGEYRDIGISELKNAIIESSVEVPSLPQGRVINNVEAFRYLEENPPVNEMELITEILNKYHRISDFSQEDLNIILNFYDIDLTTLISCEEKGYTINEAIDISILVKKYDFTIEEVEEIMRSNRDYYNITYELMMLNVSKVVLGLTNDEYGIYKSYFLRGYSYRNIDSAFIISNALGIPMEEIIIKDSEANNESVIKALIENFSDEEKERVEFLVKVYNVNFTNLLNFSKEQGYSIEDIDDKILDYHRERIIVKDEMYYLQTEEEIVDTIENKVPMLVGNGIDESIESKSGSLNRTIQGINLAGRNGMDLDLYLDYSSDDALLYNVTGSVRTRNLSGYYIRYTTTKNGVQCGSGICGVSPNMNYQDTTWIDSEGNIYVKDYGIPYYVYNIQTDYNHRTSYGSLKYKKNQMGIGWSWNIDSLDRIGNNLVLNLSSGAVYEVDFSKGGSNLEKYDLVDMVFKRSKSFSEDERISEYVLEYKNGVKKYFDNNGYLLCTENVYGEKIKYYYEYNSNFFGISDTKVLYKIIDSMGREVNVKYLSSTDRLTNGKEIQLVLPDRNKIRYILQNVENRVYKLVETIDQNNRATKYDYAVNYIKEDVWQKSGLRVDNKQILLEKVTYNTGASTTYNYEKSIRNKGKEGAEEYFRIKSRWDTKRDGKQNNYSEYTYQGNYTGFGQHNDPSSLPDTFEYETIVSDSKGIKTTFTFNNKHLLKKEEVKDNEVLTSEVVTEYDSNKLPLKVINKTYDKLDSTQVIKKVKNYQYDSSGYGDLTGQWDVQADRNSENVPINDEHKTTMEYNSVYHYVTSKTYKKDKDTIIKEELTPYPDNKNIQFARVYENNVLKAQTEYRYDSFGNIIEERQYYKDGNGNWTKYIATKYSYNDNDLNRINSGKPLNGAYLTKQWVEGVEDFDGNNLGNVEQEFKYDYLGNVIEKIDSKKNKVFCEYDNLGRITKEINADSSFKSYQYNDISNSMLVTDEEGNQFSAEYDSLGNLKSLIDVQTVVPYNDTNSQEYKDNGPFVVTGKIIKECNYDSNMKLKEEKIYNENEANKGHITTYTYFNDGRLKIKEIKEFDGTLLYYESYIYDDADPQGKYSSVTKVVKGDASSPKITTKTYIDRVGNTSILERNHEGKIYKDTFTYDYLGNKVQEKSARAYDENWTEPYTAKFEYDFAGRLIRQYNIDGNYSSTKYDDLGRVKSTTDMKGNNAAEKYSTTFEYDKLGRVLKEKIPFENKNGTMHYSVKKYHYDKNGNLIEQYVQRNKIGEAENYNKITYEYNPRNMLTKVTTYDNGITENYTQYFYDKLGNKLRMYTGLSQPLTINGLDNIVENGDREYSVTKYEYDKYSNLSKRIDPLSKEETYDKYNNTGKILQKTDRNKNIIKITYDGLNRIKTRTVTTPSGEGNTSVNYTYTLTGQIKTMNSEGITTEYLYDDLGRLTTEKDSTGVKKQYTYDAANNRKSFILSINDNIKSKIKYDYDKQNRLAKVYKSNNGIQEETASYTYDDNGNRETLQYPNGITVVYNYNLLNLLTELTNKKGTTVLSKYTYSYYLDGNREKETEERQGQSSRTREFKYDGLGRLETEKEQGKDPVEYDYDDSNNRSKKIEPFDIQNIANNIVEVSYKYNGLNQLTNAQIGSTTASYTYNGNGLRITKTINGKTTNHIWDGQNIIAETDAANNIISEYIRGINLIAVEKDNKKIFYLYNGHGDVIQLTDENGNVIKNYKYDAFGNELSIDSNDTNPFRYGGEYFDSETGLYYLRARYYDPKIGRFTTEDSYWGKDSDPLSLNLYTYCTNNPVMYLDPSGHWPQWGKLGLGLLKVAGGVLTIGATIVAAPAVGTVGGIILAGTATFGLIQGLMGSAEVVESFTGNNVIRDDFMAGNETLYNVTDGITGLGSFAGDMYIANTLLKAAVNTSVNISVRSASKGASNLDLSDDVLKWLNKGDVDNVVYFGMKDGEAVYTGITKQTLAKRLYQHNYGPKGKGLDYLETQLSNLTRNQARALEQYLIEHGPAALNKANSISPKSKYYKEALKWAENYINSLK